MELRGTYQMYPAEDDRRFSLSRICSWLYLYTIGSCRYFHTSLSREDRMELRMLWQSQDDTDTKEDHWKKKTKKADCKMRKRIRYHFKDHIRKWRDTERPRFPWKMILHFLLVVVVTVQVSLYAINNFTLTNFLIENTKLHREIFIKRESLYTLEHVYQEIEYLTNSYYTIREQSLSFLYYIENGNDTLNATKLTMEIEFNDVDECDRKKAGEFSINPNQTATMFRDLYLHNADANSTNTELIQCDNISVNCCDINYCNYNITEQIKHFINGNNIFKIKRIKFDITLGAFYHTSAIELDNAVEAVFDLEISLNNELHSGHMHADAKLLPTLRRVCGGGGGLKRYTLLDVVVMVLLMLAATAYVFSIFTSMKLSRDVKLHFLAYHRKKLSWKQMDSLFNKWYILMLFACLLLVITTILKIISEYTESISIHLIESVTILFGVGVFLLWCGLFGFLRYFESLNVLLITLTLALPSFLRFAVCMAILFMAFTFCGWVVIGPYNSGFRNPLKAAENLIGLLNGDEIIRTFQSFSNDSVSIGVSIFSRIYLILFVFIFIYVILSLFIGIFDHAYDSLSDNWKERSRGFLWDWADGEKDDDLTKSYPFPVPRIRELSSEFAMPSCDSHLNASSMSSVEDEDSTTAPVMNNKFDVPLIHQESVISQEPIRTDDNRTDHLSSDLESFRVTHKPKMRYTTYHPHNSTSNDKTNTINVPRRSEGHLGASRRRITFVKSIVAEPPDANQDDVYKARNKLQSKDYFHQSLQVTSGSDESYV